MHQSSHYIKFGSGSQYKDRLTDQVNINLRHKSLFSPLKELIGQLSFFLASVLIVTSGLSAQQEAHAQLKEVEVKEPSIEQKIDQAFGTIVGYMASVLLWDVAAWDNDIPMEIRSKLGAGQSFEDPLGWGVFVHNNEQIQLLDFEGDEISSFSQQDLVIDQVWAIQQGRELLVKSRDGAIYFFHRNIKGAVTKALGPYSLPQGQWTAFAEINQQLIFGSGEGRLYLLNRKVGEEITERSWNMPSFALNESITQIQARPDGLYWLITGEQGSARVISPLGMAKDDQLFTAEELIKVNRPNQVSGSFISSGFTEGQLWFAFSGGLFTWDSKNNRQGFSIQLPKVNAVQVFAADRDPKSVVYLVGVESGPNHIINYAGQELDLPKDPQHPMRQKVEAMFKLNGELWLANQKGLHQLSVSSDSEITVKVTLKQASSTHTLFKAGSHLIAQNNTESQVWFKADFQLPLIVLWLVFGALFFTIRMRFVNLRLFKHAIAVVQGKYTDPNSVGEVSHFQALTSALSATVGLGNIAGVAIAVGLGGPGATFWMIVAGFLGMASKFTECTLGQKYRTLSPTGEVMGGAMHYLSKGLASEHNLPRLGKVLAVLFSFLCIGGSFGGGNAFQVKQSLEAVAEVVPMLSEFKWIYGLIMAIGVGVVILGGIKSIAQTAEKIVPAMCGLYILASLYVIISNASLVPQAFAEIIGGAFSPDAIYGGAVGVLVVGFKRAAFSNEAGIGSAAIAHAAAKTDYPVREGVVALLEPFIDTIVVCTMTALVIVITGAYHNPEYGALVVGNKGAALTSQAMGEVISFFPYVLSVAVILFAYSTMISWSYYGERCWSWLFGEDPALFSMGKYASLIYKILFLVFAFLGSIVTATNILDFSDLMILGMALPNIFGILFLTKGVRADLDEYETKLNANEFPIYEPPIHEEIEAEAEAEE